MNCRKQQWCSVEPLLLVGKETLDFVDMVSTNPEVNAKGIGLQPEGFEGFGQAYRP